jgi:3-methyladenine DNA glycosylase/8-oxoguanine DNA glycosylase
LDRAEPEIIAKASLSDLRACGLSHRKAGTDFAQSVADGSLPLEAMKHATDDEVRDQLLKCRGFGTWSVEYSLAGPGPIRCLTCRRYWPAQDYRKLSDALASP